MIDRSLAPPILHLVVSKPLVSGISVDLLVTKISSYVNHYSNFKGLSKL